MPAEKKLCAGIMLCQMTAILSGVALLYLAVIVVSPSRKELELGFSTTPIMCTTVRAEDIALREPKGDKRAECLWQTCSEWCLSKNTAKCMQIHVSARSNGSKVVFHDCVDIWDRMCSGLDVNLTQALKCKKGQCGQLDGLYNCTRDDENECREITPAFTCMNNFSLETIVCGDQCKERLGGVYSCKNGACNKIEKVTQYWKDCKRKCTDLLMADVNTVILSKDRLIATTCDSVSSSSASVDNNTITSMNNDTGWINKQKVAFVFCTFIKKQNGKRAYDLVMDDCFNATLGDVNNVSNITDYRDILEYHRELSSRTSELLINTEESLSLMNITELRINTEGCSNTLSKECDKFFETHATDGLDGQSADRFPCYMTEKDYSFVVGVYNPEMTFIFMLLASIIPGTLFIVACFTLFACSKSVGVNDEGHLYLTLLKGSGNGGNMQRVVGSMHIAP